MTEKHKAQNSNISCAAVTGSMTIAMKAQKVLASAAIPSTVQKLGQAAGTRGCTYGISYSCCQSGNVRIVLENAGIRIKRYIE